MQDLVRHLEKFIEETEQYLTETVKEMLEQELPILSEEKFALFESTGNRLLYEQDYFAKRKFLTVFGVAAEWMKQEKLACLGTVTMQAVCEKLEQILFSICEEECWALPAHVNRKENPNWRNTIDLFAAETAQDLADIVDVMGENLSSRCRNMVLENVERRVLHPFFEAPVGTYDWEQASHNWNAVCNGCIGSAYLHSPAGQRQPNEQYLKRITKNLLYYIDGFGADGTCMEGLGYYFYGMTYLVNFADELYSYSAGEADLLCGDWGSFRADEREDKRTRIAAWWSKCFFACGKTVSFSDAGAEEKYRMGLACALGAHFEEAGIPKGASPLNLEEDSCYRYVPFKMDLFCAGHYLEMLRKYASSVENVTYKKDTKVSQSRCSILQDAQWCIGENTLHQVGFACKGGHNGEPHNHNDVGSFLYVAGQDMFLTDLGAGEYTKEYFSEGRYHILCNRSLGHNVPMIDGTEQLTGTVHACHHFEVTESKTEISVTMELAGAYESHKLKNYVRRLTFYKENGGLIIEDTFESEGEMKITENLVTRYRPQIRGNSIELTGKEVSCHIQKALGDEAEADSLRIVPMEHRNHEGRPEQVYLIQWDSCVKYERKEVIRITVS